MVLGQSLLLRTCEAKIPSEAAVDELRVAQPAGLLRRLIENTVGPERAVEPVERAVLLRLMVEEDGAPPGRSNAGHDALPNARQRDPRSRRRVEEGHRHRECGCLRLGEGVEELGAHAVGDGMRVDHEQLGHGERRAFARCKP